MRPRGLDVRPSFYGNANAWVGAQRCSAARNSLACRSAALWSAERESVKHYLTKVGVEKHENAVLDAHIEHRELLRRKSPCRRFHRTTFRVG